MKDLIAKNLKVLIHPHPALRQVCSDIKNISSEDIQQLIVDMTKTMKNWEGVGLAAPQVGRAINLLLVDDGSEVEIFINPKIIFRSFGKIVMEEGCLSIPKVYGTVKRPEYVWVIYKDKTGRLRFKKVTGLKARILQHEVDHLNGILFIDKNRLERITQGQEFFNKYEGRV